MDPDYLPIEDEASLTIHEKLVELTEKLIEAETDLSVAMNVVDRSKEVVAKVQEKIDACLAPLGNGAKAYDVKSVIIHSIKVALERNR